MLKKLTVLQILCLTVFLTTLLAGCGNPESRTTSQGDSSQIQENQSSYPMTFNDDSGTEVYLPSQPNRIISLIPSATETLYALGLGDKVIAVTKWDDYPADAAKNAEYIFEDGLNVNVEQILNLNPDLIILGTMNQNIDALENVRNLKIPVVVTDPQTLERTYQTIESLGRITNTSEQSRQLTAKMKEKEQSVIQKISALKPTDRLRVWLEIDETLFTPGQGTFLNELLTKAGGINIAEDIQGWGQYNSEQVISKNPQVIFETYDYYQKNVTERIMARQGWESVDAVKNNRVVALDNNLVTRPGPRITDGLEVIAKTLYPDLFK